LAQSRSKDQATCERLGDIAEIAHVGHLASLDDRVCFYTSRISRYLLTYDPLSFQAYLETLIASNSPNTSGGNQPQSLWLFTDSANAIFRLAKQRCFKVVSTSESRPFQSNSLDEGQEARAAAAEIEGQNVSGTTQREASRVEKWSLDGIDPVLEELPKWSLLATILQEIEGEILRQESTHSTTCACITRHDSNIK